jgi:riboflavin kinase/FMN adenylyltransferase
LTENFLDFTAEQFVKEVLVNQLNVKKLLSVMWPVPGFGQNRTANITDLELYGKKYNFEAEHISQRNWWDCYILPNKECNIQGVI